jgi:glucan endo-1,3-beta-D-glucosidase
MRFTSTIAAGVLAMGVAAQEGKNYLGFNSGATLADGTGKVKKDFLAEFKTQNNLKNAPGDFNSVRLYTNIQAGTDNDPISAFEAAIETDTNILLGVWASGTDNIDNEIAALKKAVQQHGSKLADLVIGITIGSEDLYRNSVQGVKNDAGVGNSPNAIIGFIDDFRKAFKTGPLAKIPVGHADTWDAWDNSTVKGVIEASDFIAVHEYPYYENDKGNHINNAGELFDKAYETTLRVAGGKPVWVTETGWPYIGPDWDEAEATVKNAEKYWQEVGCKKLFNKTPTFWYTLRDSNPDNKMKFAITDNLSTEPRWDLTCKSTKDTPKPKPSNSTTTGSHPKSTHASKPSSTFTSVSPSIT